MTIPLAALLILAAQASEPNDYEDWAGAAPGAWVKLHTERPGLTGTSTRRLLHRTDEKLAVEFRLETEDMAPSTWITVFAVWSPPRLKTLSEGAETLTLAGKTLECRWREHKEGSSTLRLWRSDAVPGRLVKMQRRDPDGKEIGSFHLLAWGEGPVEPERLAEGRRQVAFAFPGGRPVDNPDYARWAAFGVGSWVKHHTPFGGSIHETTEKLVQRSADVVVVESSFRNLSRPGPPEVTRLAYPAKAPPGPARRDETSGQEDLAIEGKKVPCRWSEWSVDDRRLKRWESDAVPGRLVQTFTFFPKTGYKTTTTAAAWEAVPAK